MGNDVVIIIPAYNAGETISRCLRSIKNQTFVNYRVVVIDDGSKDDTVQQISPFLVDSRFICVQQSNSGVSVARNRGLVLSNDERFTLFIDADDWLETDYLKKMVDAMEDDIDFAFCDWTKYSRNGTQKEAVNNKFGKNTEIVDVYSHYLESRNGGAPWAKIFLTKIINDHNIRFDQTLPYGEDYLFLLEYLNHAKKCRYLKEPLYGYDCQEIGAGAKFRKNLFTLQMDIEDKKRKIVNVKDIMRMNSATVRIIGICFQNLMNKQFTMKERFQEFRQIHAKIINDYNYGLHYLLHLNVERRYKLWYLIMKLYI